MRRAFLPLSWFTVIRSDDPIGLLDLRREHVFGRLEIVARLNVHPERSAGLEEFASRSAVSAVTGFSSRDAFDPGARHVQRGRVSQSTVNGRKKLNCARNNTAWLVQQRAWRMQVSQLLSSPLLWFLTGGFLHRRNLVA